MSDERLPREVQQAIEAEQGRAGPPAEQLEQVHARLQASLGLPGPGGPTGASGLKLLAVVASVVAVGGGIATYLAIGRGPTVETRARTKQVRKKGPAKSPAVTVTGATRTPSTLAAERAILDRARRALGGQPAVALEAVVEHERRFPGGRLVEERDGLRILALVGLGRHDQARAAERLFRRRYPHSLLLPAIEAALDRK